MATRQVVIDKDCCDHCEEEHIEPPAEATAQYDVTINGWFRPIMLCPAHNRAFEPLLVMVYASPYSTEVDKLQPDDTPAAFTPPQLALEPGKDSAETVAAPAATPKPPTAVEKLPPPRQEPIPSVEVKTPPTPEEAQKGPVVARYGPITCLDCKDAGQPADVHTMPYKKRAAHAHGPHHRASMEAIRWEAHYLKFPCREPKHVACQRTGFAFPTDMLRVGHEKDTAKAARVAGQLKRQEKILEKHKVEPDPTLVWCPLAQEHECGQELVMPAKARKGHAEGTHKKGPWEIPWREHGDRFAWPCTAHPECAAGDYRYPTEQARDLHSSPHGVAAEKAREKAALAG